MRLTRLRISQLRCFQTVELTLTPGMNLLIGPNGAGKSSVIEAVHLLGYGRSFRGRVRDGLIRTGADHLEIYAEWEEDAGRSRRVGLRHSGHSWEARLDATIASNLTELCAEIAVVTFEPGSHDLIGGGAEHRRRFLDWGVFHVEQTFLPLWRRYTRALKQRNALLKSHPAATALLPWDRELADAGEVLNELRESYLNHLELTFAATVNEFLPELGRAHLEFQPGWKRAELRLADALLLNQERDLSLGYTTIGPHRADWRVDFAELSGREALSRGQEKLTALACVLAQARRYALDRGEWPIICLDDFASELDTPHQKQVLSAALTSGAQMLLTGTEIPAAFEALNIKAQVFHVEQKQIWTQ